MLLDFFAVVTVNDYLAQRDAEWMGRVHRFLGLSVGLIQVSVLLLVVKYVFVYDVFRGGVDWSSCFNDVMRTIGLVFNNFVGVIVSEYSFINL